MDTQPDNLYEEDPWNEPICQNCCRFFHHNDDEDSMGICSLDKDFEPYWDNEELMDHMDFSCCRALYLEKCFDGLREACETFETAAIDDIPEGMSIETYFKLESSENTDLSELFRALRHENPDMILYALDKMCTMIRCGDVTAYKGLISYYMALEPVTTLEEAHFRIRIIDTLSTLPRSTPFIELYVQELARTPSNNQTRKLYTRILKELDRYPQEEICGPLEQLLSQVKYSYKIKRRIKEVAGLIETDEDNWFYIFRD